MGNPLCPSVMETLPGIPYVLFKSWMLGVSGNAAVLLDAKFSRAWRLAVHRGSFCAPVTLDGSREQRDHPSVARACCLLYTTPCTRGAVRKLPLQWLELMAADISKYGTGQ